MKNFENNGWFKTGDIGYIDNDGYIYITGRKKNVIILSNGKNVFPEELEEHLSHCELIKESVVIGRKSEATGEVAITALIHPDYEKARGKIGRRGARDYQGRGKRNQPLAAGVQAYVRGRDNERGI